MTYDELIRRYPTNAPEMPWYDLSDAELRADLRIAHALRERGGSARQVTAGGRIADWITQELTGRAASHAARSAPARAVGLV